MLNEMDLVIRGIAEDVRSGFADMRDTFARIEKRLDRFERKFDVLTSDIVDLRERLADIERKPN